MTMEVSQSVNQGDKEAGRGRTGKICPFFLLITSAYSLIITVSVELHHLSDSNFRQRAQKRHHRLSRKEKKKRSVTLNAFH